MILDYLAKIYHKSLSARARKYLNDRGITDQAINHFNIGFSSNNGYKECLKFGFTTKEMKDSLMFREIEGGAIFDAFYSKIIFPISVANTVYSFTSRSIGDDWKRTKMSSAHIHREGNLPISFNEDALTNKKNKYIIIVESPIDCITLAIRGFNAIAIFGVNRISRTTISNLYNKTVYLLFDKDSNKVGQKASLKIAQKLLDNKIRSSIVSFPKKYGQCDANEFFLRGGTRAELMNLINGSSVFEGKQTSKKRVKEAFDNRDIVEVVESHIEIERVGERYKGICPFHLDSKPSFIVYPSTNSFHCFGCGASGGVKQFLYRITN